MANDKIPHSLLWKMQVVVVSALLLITLNANKISPVCRPSLHIVGSLSNHNSCSTALFYNFMKKNTCNVSQMITSLNATGTYSMYRHTVTGTHKRKSRDR